MSPQWLVSVMCLILLMAPVPVTPQVSIIITVLKTTLCTVCSAVFVLASCAPRERLLCRVIAFKLKLLCNTYPCTNYGAPSQRKCALPPFGCLPWNIRIRGLCEPFKLCCAKGGSFNARNEQQTHFALPYQAKDQRSNLNERSVNTKVPPTIEPKKPASDLVNNEVPRFANKTDFHIPLSAQEYMEDWVENEDDPAIAEQVIKLQYDKLLKELHAINKQETELGREVVSIPGFEEFRSVALGEIPV